VAATARASKTFDEKRLRGLASMARKSPFVLRITAWTGYEAPVVLVNERIGRERDEDTARERRARLVKRGHIYGEALRRVTPVIRQIVEGVTDDAGVALELQRFLTREGLRLRDLNLPLDQEAGAKLALLFRLQDRVKDNDRVELMGLRLARFGREEAAYWLSRCTGFNPDENRWAVTGLRIVLCGESGDRAVAGQLQRQRARG